MVTKEDICRKSNGSTAENIGAAERRRHICFAGAASDQRTTRIRKNYVQGKIH
jgi:hypothetical protein